MDWWIWLIIAFVLLGIELLTTTFHVAFFAIGAGIVAILSLLGPGDSLWLQIAVFLLSSVAFMFILRIPLREKLGLEGLSEEIDSISNESGIAIETIAPGATGKIELRGTAWSGRNDGERVIENGQSCTIEGIDGLALVIRPAADAASSDEESHPSAIERKK